MQTTTKGWTRTATIRPFIDAAEDAPEKVPALLLAMAQVVEGTDESFAEELRDAAEMVEDSDDAEGDANYWLAQFYDWADACRVWIQ